MKPRSSNTGCVPMPSRLRRELRGPMRVGEPRELRALCSRCGHHECSCPPRAVAQPEKPRTWRDETTPEPFVEGVG